MAASLLIQEPVPREFQVDDDWGVRPSSSSLRQTVAGHQRGLSNELAFDSPDADVTSQEHWDNYLTWLLNRQT